MRAPRLPPPPPLPRLGGIPDSPELAVAELVRRDGELVATATEIGLIDQGWLEDPDRHPFTPAAPPEVLERFLERSVEQRPSLLATLGLSTVRFLASSRAGVRDATGPATVVFTDLEGFTRFTADEGDDVASQVLRDHRHTVRQLVRRRRGRVLKQMGDGFLLLFVAPGSAVRAALDLVESAPASLPLRAGLHHGEVIVADSDVFGHVVNLAARVTEAAAGGHVLVTVDVRDAVGVRRGVEFGPVRRRRLKGIPELVGMCAARPAGPAVPGDGR